MEPTRVLPRSRLLGREFSELRNCRVANPSAIMEWVGTRAPRCLMQIACKLVVACRLVPSDDRKRTTRGVVAAIPLPASPTEIVATPREGDRVGTGVVAG